MTTSNTSETSLADRATALTAVMRRTPPRLRFTPGMAAHARRLEREADRG